MQGILTTTVANYYVKPEQHAEARNIAMIVGNEALFQLWNGRGERIQSIGKLGIVPDIWTHTPVPFGMDIIALKDNFEKRATSVLGDYDSPVDLTKCSSPDDLYNDNRYWSVTVRAASMMYVDQAIEHYNSK